MAILRPMPHVAKQIRICKNTVITEKSRMKQRHHDTMGMLYAEQSSEDVLFPSASFVYLELQALAKGWEDWKQASTVFRTFLTAVRNENLTISHHMLQNLKLEIRYYLQQMYLNIPEQARQLERWYELILRFANPASKALGPAVFSREMEYLEQLWQAASRTTEQQIYEKWNKLMPVRQNGATVFREERQSLFAKEIQRELEKIERFCDRSEVLRDLQKVQGAAALDETIEFHTEERLQESEPVSWHAEPELNQYFAYLDAEEWLTTIDQLMQEKDSVISRSLAEKIMLAYQSIPDEWKEDTQEERLAGDTELQMELLQVRDRFLKSVQSSTQTEKQELYERLSHNTVLTAVAEQMGISWQNQNMAPVELSVESDSFPSRQPAVDILPLSDQQQMELIQGRDRFLSKVLQLAPENQSELIRTIRETPLLQYQSETLGIDWDQDFYQNIETFLTCLDAGEWVQTVRELESHKTQMSQEWFQNEIEKEFHRSEEISQVRAEKSEPEKEQILRTVVREQLRGALREMLESVTEFTEDQIHSLISQKGLQSKFQWIENIRRFSEQERTELWNLIRQQNMGGGEDESPVPQNLEQMYETMSLDEWVRNLSYLQNHMGLISSDMLKQQITREYETLEAQLKEINSRFPTETEAQSLERIYEQIWTKTAESAESQTERLLEERYQESRRTIVQDIRQLGASEQTELWNLIRQENRWTGGIQEDETQNTVVQNLEQAYERMSQIEWVQNLSYLQSHRELIQSDILKQQITREYEKLETQLKEIYNQFPIDTEAGSLERIYEQIRTKAAGPAESQTERLLEERYQESRRTIMQDIRQLGASEQTELWNLIRQENRWTGGTQEDETQNTPVQNLEQVYESMSQTEWIQNLSYLQSHRELIQSDMLKQQITREYEKLETQLKEIYSRFPTETEAQSLERIYEQIRTKAAESAESQTERLLEEQYQESRRTIMQDIRQLGETEQTELWNLIRQENLRTGGIQENETQNTPVQNLEQAYELMSQTEWVQNLSYLQSHRDLIQSDMLKQQITREYEKLEAQLREINSRFPTETEAQSLERIYEQIRTKAAESAESQAERLLEERYQESRRTIMQDIRQLGETEQTELWNLIRQENLWTGGIQENETQKTPVRNLEQAYERMSQTEWVQNLSYLQGHRDLIQSDMLRQQITREYEKLEAQLREINSRFPTELEAGSLERIYEQIRTKAEELSESLESTESRIERLLKEQYQESRRTVMQDIRQLGASEQTELWNLIRQENLWTGGIQEDETQNTPVQNLEQVYKSMSQTEWAQNLSYLQSHRDLIQSDMLKQQITREYEKLESRRTVIQDIRQLEESRQTGEPAAYERLGMPSMVVTRPQPPSFKNMPSSWQEKLGRQMEQKAEEVFQRSSVKMMEKVSDITYDTDIRQSVQGTAPQEWKQRTEKLEKEIQTQEKLLTELQQNQSHLASDEMMKKIVDHTLREMQQELKIERMRRGLR